MMEVKQLEGEKQESLKELRLAESRSNQGKDEDNTDTLVTLLDAKGENLTSVNLFTEYFDSYSQ